MIHEKKKDEEKNVEEVTREEKDDGGIHEEKKEEGEKVEDGTIQGTKRTRQGGRGMKEGRNPRNYNPITYTPRTRGRPTGRPSRKRNRPIEID